MAQTYLNLVDLVKSCPTSIYLQTSASILPRTSLLSFGGHAINFFIRLLTRYAKLPKLLGRLLRELLTLSKSYLGQFVREKHGLEMNIQPRKAFGKVQFFRGEGVTKKVSEWVTCSLTEGELGQTAGERATVQRKR